MHLDPGYNSDGVLPTSVTVKEDSADQPFTFENLSGKNIFVCYSVVVDAIRLFTHIPSEVSDWRPRCIHRHMF